MSQLGVYYLDNEVIYQIKLLPFLLRQRLELTAGSDEKKKQRSQFLSLSKKKRKEFDLMEWSRQEQTFDLKLFMFFFSLFSFFFFFADFVLSKLLYIFFSFVYQATSRDLSFCIFSVQNRKVSF